MKDYYYLFDFPLFTASILVFLFALLISLVALRKMRQNNSLRYEFITIIAHKFRTPLTHIKLVSEMLVDSEKDPYRLENIKELAVSNTLLIKLTGTLIELTGSNKSFQSSYSFENLGLGEIARKVSDSIKFSFKDKNISFVVEYAEDVLVHIDRNRMEFVLQTIFENAYIYTQTGGKVIVRIEKSGRKAILTVTDNGIGIPRNEQRKVFSKFHRAPNAQLFDTEGLGVGLYLTKSILERMHGKIKVFSNGERKGTSFKISLPVARKRL